MHEGGCACFQRRRYSTRNVSKVTTTTAAATPTPVLAPAGSPPEDDPLDTGGEMKGLTGEELDEVEVVVEAMEATEVEDAVFGVPIFHPIRATT